MYIIEVNLSNTVNFCHRFLLKYVFYQLNPLRKLKKYIIIINTLFKNRFFPIVSNFPGAQSNHNREQSSNKKKCVCLCVD